MPIFQFHKDHTIPSGDWVWVFGSNDLGVHGAGAAKIARSNFRAQLGQGVGLTGDAYGIVTRAGYRTPDMRELKFRTLPLVVISKHIAAFIEFAKAHPQMNFFVTRVACELAGYSDATIAPLFRSAPSNCSFANEWMQYLSRQEAA